MSATSPTPTTENRSKNTETDDEKPSLVGRREFMQASAGAALAVAASGTSAADSTTTEETTDPETVNYSSDYTQVPWVTASVTVDETGTVDLNGETHDLPELGYIDDSEEVGDLADEGVRLARHPDPVDGVPQAHNPVTLRASNIDAEEYRACPRGITYDDDADSSTDEVDVSILDATHWSTTDATNGSITVADDADALSVSASGVASGETVTATFDFASVGSEDATISDPARKFFQAVADATVDSGATVEFRFIDSTGTTAKFVHDPAGDASTTQVVSNSDGPSQTWQERIGELSTTLEDIQQFEIAVLEANADLAFYGLNLERATEWTFGTREYVNADDELETETVIRPSGDYSITSLSALEDTVFSSATLHDVTFGVEQKASLVADDEVMVRVEDNPDTYDRDKTLEYVVEWVRTQAYALSWSPGKLRDEVGLPESRYSSVEAATGISDLEDWDDVDGVSWTDRTSNYGAVGEVVDLLTALTAGDRQAYRIKLYLDDDEVTDATSESGDEQVAVAAGGDDGGSSGEGLFGGAKSAILGVVSVVLGVLGIKHKWGGEGSQG